MLVAADAHGRDSSGLQQGSAEESSALQIAALQPQPSAPPLRVAQDAARAFNIPPQPLADALVQFGRQSGLQVSLDPELVAGLTTQGIVDNQTPRHALDRMLQGTGLTTSFTGRSVVVAQAATGITTDANLDTITVQGEGTSVAPEAGAEQSFGVPAIVIGPAQLDTAGDLQDVFAQVPGVSVGSSLPISQKLYVHGIEETNLAVTIDGARQNNKIFHHNATNLIDPSLLKAVRIDPGVAPADAGPGALAGAIQFETRDVKDLLEPGKVMGGFVKGGYDTNSEAFTASGSVYAMGGGFEVLGYYNRVHGQNYTDGNGVEVLGSEARLKSGLAKIAYEAQSGDRFEFSYERVHDDADRPYRANFRSLVPPRGFEPAVRPFDLIRRNMVFTYTDEKPNGWWDPKLVVARSGSDLYVPYTLRNGTEIDAFGSTDSVSGKFENRFPVAFGDVTAGVDFYDDIARFRDPFEPSTEEADNVGFYAQARLEFAERFRLSFGGRHDDHNFVGTTGEVVDSSGFSGNVGGEIDVTNFLTLNAGYSDVFSGVPLAEPYIMKSTWGYANVLPVKARNAVAGLTVRHRGFTFEGSVFRTDIYDAQDPAYGTFGAADGRDIRHDVRSEGYELGAEYVWGSGNFGVNYADIEMTEDGGPLTSDAQYIGTPIGQMLSLFFAQRVGNTNVTVGGDMQVAFEYDEYAGFRTAFGDVLLPLDGYTVVNLFAEYKPQRMAGLTLRAEVNNVFDEAYADRASYGGEFSDLLEQLLEPGRSVFLTAKKEF